MNIVSYGAAWWRDIQESVIGGFISPLLFSLIVGPAGNHIANAATGVFYISLVTGK
jgi:hypothetical protein